MTRTLSALALAMALPQLAYAEGADVAAARFVAATPSTYNHSAGGGAFNDGSAVNVTGQLDGSQFSCGDTVTYLAQIQMADQTRDANQTLDLDLRFPANSSDQSGAALADITHVGINYGLVENSVSGYGAYTGAGQQGLDAGILDDGGSQATLVNQSLTGPLYQAGSELTGTVRVTDLEAGERVVVRIDARLSCKADSQPAGNLPVYLDGLRVAAPVAEATAIAAQTVPFTHAEAIQGAGAPLLTLNTTVTRADGSCGSDDAETISVDPSTVVKYCYSIDNPGTMPLYGITLVANNGTPADTSDDTTLFINALSGVSGTVREALVTMPGSATTLVNTARATGGSSGYGSYGAPQLTASDSATVTVKPAANNAPVASDDRISTRQDTPVTLNVLANDSDVDNNLDTDQVTLKQNPAHGTAVNEGSGNVTYTPNSGFQGSDNFVYQVCDTQGACDNATVSVDVKPANYPPTANDDSVATQANTPVNVNVIANDTDLDANLDATSTQLTQGPANGSVANQGNGVFIYTPTTDYQGYDHFDYQVCDTQGACDGATVTVAVEPLNHPPVANDDAAVTQKATPVEIAVTANDTDLDGNLDSSSTSLVQGPANGSVVNHGDGIFTYTPNAGYQGPDSFVYQVCDAAGACDTATVTVTVDVAHNRSITVDLQDFTLSGQQLEGTVLITNQSGGYDAKITDMAIGVEYRVPKQSWTPVAVVPDSCSFNPALPFVVIDQQSVAFTGCELEQAVPAKATVRVTANAKLFGRIRGQGHADGWYLGRLSH